MVVFFMKIPQYTITAATTISNAITTNMKSTAASTLATFA